MCVQHQASGYVLMSFNSCLWSLSNTVSFCTDLSIYSNLPGLTSFKNNFLEFLHQSFPHIILRYLHTWGTNSQTTSFTNNPTIHPILVGQIFPTLSRNEGIIQTNIWKVNDQIRFFQTSFIIHGFFTEKDDHN